jgi:tetratricopeptide (TPR) repeat protein
MGNPNEKQETYKKSLLGNSKNPTKRRRLANVRTVTLRVYADQALRTQRVEWKVRLRRLVARANPILERELRLRLVVEFTKPWYRAASPDDMAAMLRELEGLDPGEDTEWVLGLVTPLSFTTPSLHELGVARLGGRHMVLRSASAVGRAGRRAMGEPQDVEVVTLLHEVGHILGEGHARGERDFMFSQMRKTLNEFNGDRAKRMKQRLLARFTAPANRAIARTQSEPEPPPKSSAVAAMIDSANAATDRTKALQILSTAAARLEALKLDDDALWLQLATGFRAQYAVSSTERALGHMKTPQPTHATARWVITTRARTSLPRTGVGVVPAAREPLYVELVNELIALVPVGQPVKTRRTLKRLARRFPRSAGLAVGRCYHAVYLQQDRAARRYCKRALAIHPGSSWASYLLGFLERRRGRFGKAAAWMNKAIAVDPDLQPAWRELAEIYIKLEDTGALNKLIRDYESRFAEPLRL